MENTVHFLLSGAVNIHVSYKAYRGIHFCHLLIPLQTKKMKEATFCKSTLGMVEMIKYINTKQKNVSSESLCLL